MKNKSEQIKWLVSEINKDSLDLENQKKQLINEIKKTKKEEIVKPKLEPKKLTIWQRIRKVLMI
jgi:hypothetical protein